jgi:cysteine-rich repeat protein
MPQRAGTGWLRAHLLFVLMSLAASAPATAQVDMTGPWFVRVFPIFLPPLDCAIDMVQTGTALSISSADCPFLVSMNLTGTIDPMTGDFTASGSSTACSMLNLTAGTASLDGTTFFVQFNCMGGGFPVLGGVYGYRCGNGVIDSGVGEICDDGNHQSGDCCSNTCQYEPAGQFCFPTDANFCTDDICDGAGTCIHVNGTGNCDDGNQCTSGDHCQDGDCVSTVLPDGSDCTDFNDCTGDSC